MGDAYLFRVGISVDVELHDRSEEEAVVKRFIEALRPVIDQNFREHDTVTGFIEHPESDEPISRFGTPDVGILFRSGRSEPT